jgi:hypothetical protein
MILIALSRVAAVAAIVAAGITAEAAAQTTAADPHHPDALAQTMTPAESEGAAGQGQGAQPGQPGMMRPGMMSGMPVMGMHRHMMKVMFAIADTDADGALSFDEITAIHKRIFDKVDADKDGKVTSEEIQAFMRE